MKEGSVLKGLWGLKLVCACPVHGTWLRDTCPRCNACCSWTDAVQTHCLCGTSLAEADSEIAEGAVLAFTQLLCGEAASPCTEPALIELTTPEVHRLARYLGAFHASVRPAHPGQIQNVHCLQVARSLVEGVSALLTNWPVRLHERISEIQATAPRGPSVRRTFAPLYRVLYNDLPGPSYQFLRTAFEGYLNENWWGLVCRRNKRFECETVKKHPRITLPQMATAAGVPESVLRHLVQAELIPATSAALPSGRHSLSIHSNELLRIKMATHGAYSLGQAACALALPKGRLRDLIAAGVVTPLISRQTNREAAAWLIPQVEVERLHVSPDYVMATPDAVSLRETLKHWRWREHEAVALVKAVVDGEVPVLGRAQDRVPIGHAMLSASATRAWRIKHRMQSGEGLSVVHAAKELGLKQQVAYDLVHSGLLKSSGSGVLGRRIKPEDIESFRARYVSLAELAKKMRCSPRALLAQISATPVCGPFVDGARQYFFLREGLLSTH